MWLWVCSEKSNGKGRRYFACSNAKVSVGVIVRTYTKRWAVELFHHTRKTQLGMFDAGVKDFESQTSHIHWVYCAYLLLHKLKLPGAEPLSLLQRQRQLQKLVEHAPFDRKIEAIVAARTQYGGIKRQQSLIEAARYRAHAAQSLARST